MHKTPKDWAAVIPKMAASGSVAQATNVLTMALQDIAELAKALEASECGMRDMRAELEAHYCPTCDGKGWVENPDARWSMEYVEGIPTGIYGTNDPEEIDCPQCAGAGFINTRPRPPVEPASANAPAPLDDDMPF